MCPPAEIKPRLNSVWQNLITDASQKKQNSSLKLFKELRSLKVSENIYIVKLTKKKHCLALMFYKYMVNISKCFVLILLVILFCSNFTSLLFWKDQFFCIVFIFISSHLVHCLRLLSFLVSCCHRHFELHLICLKDTEWIKLDFDSFTEK